MKEVYRRLWASSCAKRLFGNGDGCIVPLMLASEVIAQGRQARKENELSAARAYYAEAAKIYREQNDLLAYAHTIRHVADIYLHELNFVEARPLYEESLDLYRGDLNTKLLDLANAVRPYALLNERSGNPDEAMQLWKEARNLYASLRLDAGVNECESHIESLQQARAVSPTHSCEETA